MSQVSLIVQERDFHGQYDDADDSSVNNPILTQGVYIGLNLIPGDALSEVQGIICQGSRHR